jgi:hypothetical protein
MNFRKILTLIILNIYHINIMGFFVDLSNVSPRSDLASKLLTRNSLMDNRLPSFTHGNRHPSMEKEHIKRDLQRKKQKIFKLLKIFVDLTKPRHIFIGK